MAVLVRMKMGKDRVVEKQLWYKAQEKSASGITHIIIDNENRRMGSVKKIGSQYELTFRPTSLGGLRKTFKAKSIKQAILDAVSHWNAMKDGRVCTVCDKEFKEPLKNYHGCPTCPEHSNSDWVMTL